MTLRRWQAEALPLALESIRANRAGIVRAVMGAGKTVLCVELLRALPHCRILITAPTIRLVEQLRAAIEHGLGERVGTWYTHGREMKRITIACHPSLADIPDDYYPDVWIADEAHRTNEPVVVDWARFGAPPARLGLSATPYHADAEQRISLFTDVVYRYDAPAALADGVVVPWVVMQAEDEYEDADAAVIDMVRRHCDGPGVVNAVDITDAETFAAIMTDAGLAAEAIHSRLGEGEWHARVARLRDGKLRALVHVNQLAEGVDFPWLRWLALRRKTTNRVRFAQEVGRALRSAPGKDRAIILDPHDLFEAYSLTQEEALGGGVPDRPAPRPTPETEADELRVVLSRIDRMHIPVEVTRRYRVYLRRLVIACEATGLLNRKVSSKHWRSRPATPKQINLLQRIQTYPDRRTFVPIEHRKVLSRLCSLDDLSSGDVSDLIDVILCTRRDWPSAYLADAYGLKTLVETDACE